MTHYLYQIKNTERALCVEDKNEQENCDPKHYLKVNVKIPDKNNTGEIKELEKPDVI